MTVSYTWRKTLKDSVFRSRRYANSGGLSPASERAPPPLRDSTARASSFFIHSSSLKTSLRPDGMRLGNTGVFHRLDVGS